MTIRALAAAVTVITGIGMATSAEAGCSGRSFSDVAPPPASVEAASNVRPSRGEAPSIAWVQPEGAPVTLESAATDDEILAAYRQYVRSGRIPLDMNGMPRRRC